MTYRLGFELEIPWETGEAPPEQSIGVLDRVGQSTLRDTFHDDTEVTWERIGGSQYGYESRVTPATRYLYALLANETHL